MYKELLTSLTTICLLSPFSLQAWSRAHQVQVTEPSVSQNFPFSQTQAWYTEESYLLLKPYVGSMSYGNKDSFEQTDNTTYTNKIKVKEPAFEWSSGVRIGVGRYLPQHDLWDVSFTATYLYSDAHDKVQGNTAQGVGFNPSFLGDAITPRDKGTFDWRLNYWIVDLIVGRQFNMTKSIVFHPYFGIRGSFQYQHGKETGVVSQNAGQSLVKTLNAKSVFDNDFWGVGARIGTSFVYYFEKSFSFLVNFSTSLLAGGQHLKLNFYEETVTNNSGDVSHTFAKLNSKDSLGVIRSNMEAALGIGWETWLKNNTIRIAPSVAFEGALWFAMNQLYKLNPEDSVTLNQEERRNGNVGLMGVSFNLQVDF